MVIDVAAFQDQHSHIYIHSTRPTLNSSSPLRRRGRKLVECSQGAAQRRWPRRSFTYLTLNPRTKESAYSSAALVYSKSSRATPVCVCASAEEKRGRERARAMHHPFGPATVPSPIWSIQGACGKYSAPKEFSPALPCARPAGRPPDSIVRFSVTGIASWLWRCKMNDH